MRWSVPVLLSLLALGCARNAIFELEVELPAQPPGAPLFAFAQASEELDFGGDWSELEGAPLGPLAASCMRPATAAPCEERLALDPACSEVLSVVAGGGRTGPLRVRVRFCESARCDSAADASAPEARVTVERAFYEAAYTQGRACIDEVPAAPQAIGIARCDVRCREGTAVQHCRADGTHFCE